MTALTAESPAVRSRNTARAARRGMFRTCDRIDAAKARHDAVLIADARTSMCDYPDSSASDAAARAGAGSADAARPAPVIPPVGAGRASQVSQQK